MGSGWIKLHRELLVKAIWMATTPEQKVILVTILLKANHKEAQWEWCGEKFHVQPGQFITSYQNLAGAAGKGITIQNVRTALKKFQNYEFLTYEPTHTGTLISVINWALYQSSGEESNTVINTGLTQHQHGLNTELTTNKKDKNNNKKDYEHFFEKLWQLYSRKKGKGQVSATQKKKLYTIGWDVMEMCIKKFKLDMERMKRPPDMYPYGSTFFNSGYVDYLDKEKPTQPTYPETKLEVVIAGTLDEM